MIAWNSESANSARSTFADPAESESINCFVSKVEGDLRGTSAAPIGGAAPASAAASHLKPLSWAQEAGLDNFRTKAKLALIKDTNGLHHQQLAALVRAKGIFQSLRRKSKDGIPRETRTFNLS